MAWKFGKSVYVRLDERYAVDVFNTLYADVRHPIALDDKTGLFLGVQYYPQTSVGANHIGSFWTWGCGLQAVVKHGPFGIQFNLTTGAPATAPRTRTDRIRPTIWFR